MRQLLCDRFPGQGTARQFTTRGPMRTREARFFWVERKQSHFRVDAFFFFSLVFFCVNFSASPVHAVASPSMRRAFRSSRKRSFRHLCFGGHEKKKKKRTSEPGADEQTKEMACVASSVGRQAAYCIRACWLYTFLNFCFFQSFGVTQLRV